MRTQVIFLAVIYFGTLPNLFAQTPYFEGQTDGDFRLLLLPDHQKLTFHQHGSEAFLSLYGQNNELIDQLPIEYKPDETSETVLAALGKNRYFLQAGSHSYNFQFESDKISLLKIKPLPKAPRGTIKTVFFFDATKSATVFLNEREQYNVYIDSAETTLEKTETFGTSHQGGIQSHPQRPTKTPIFIYSKSHRELFLHLPTDISFLILSLEPHDILKALIYLEPSQLYTFRRYYDEVNHQRYALKEEGKELMLFKVSGFDPLNFTRDYQSIKESWKLDFTPLTIYDNQLLKSEVQQKGEYKIHRFCLIPIEDIK